MRIQAKRLELDIPIGTPLTGRARINRECKINDGVLEANVLLLSSSSKHVIIIVLDTLFGARWLEQHLESKLSKDKGGADINVITVGTHTHFAPGLDRNKPLIGAIDLKWQASLADQLKRELDVMLRSPDATQNCTANISVGHIPLSVSRRKPWRWPLLSRATILRFPKIVLAPNYNEPVDQTAAIATICDSAGNPICVLANWAAHPTIYPNKSSASAEYIGIVRSGIRDKIGADIPVLFFQGFAGDLRPIPPANRIPIKALLMHGPQFAAFDIDTWRQFSQKLTGYFLKMLDAKSISETTFSAPVFTQSHAQLADLIDGDNGGGPICFRHVAISKSLSFVFVPAEPSSAYSVIVRAAFPNAWPTGYSGDVFGYWPTDKQASEGGYEAIGFFPLFGLKGKFFGRNDAVFSDMIRTLKNKMQE